ncbi:MAG: cadherin-like beta sandwich domain-containing protein, partial [Bacteroidales bacterium]|nr:cadherin-like beta sandwich domain-containing protein [Bacteroidales bacterium]
MKKIFFFCILINVTLLLSPKGWLIYDGSVLPIETSDGNDSLDISDLSEDSRGANFIKEIIDDIDIPGNKVLKAIWPDDGAKLLYRHYFDSTYTGNFTLAARLKGCGDPDIRRVFDFQWRNGYANRRDELRIWPGDSTIELEKADTTVKVNYNLNEWHIYRVSVVGGSAAVYIDENPEPVLTAVTTSTTSDKYLKIGDAASTTTVGGYVDWVVLTTSGAFSPEEKGLPSYLTGLSSSWLFYEANVMPSETNKGGNMLDISNESDKENGPNFVHEIIEDLDIPDNKILKYFQPDDGAGFLYRNYFDANWTDSSFTIAANLKGTGIDSIERIFDIQWYNGNANTQDELLIWPTDSTIELEEANTSIKVNYNLNEWHIYRINVFGDSAAVYIDENPDPVLTGKTTTNTTNKEIKLGDASTDVSVGGFIDWILLDTTGAYTPDDLSLPAFLSHLPTTPSSDATLASLTFSSGTLSPAFHPDTLTYYLELPAGTANLTISALKNDENAQVTGDGLITTFPDTAVIIVTAEDGTVLNYTIYIALGTAPSSDTTLSALTVSVG